jgi:Ankyrin repeats (3 copies)
MVAIAKQPNPPDAATLELWHVAETNDVEELKRILPRVPDINARNKHGVTALMRAACHGHKRMVRALLDHGADPNLARNDKFTALALAAFFGHTETVKTLMDGGARTEMVTRCGTSAHMWAKARTFVEVAQCLESHTPARQSTPAPPRAKPAPAPPTPLVVKRPRTPLVVKTLKDPPEIWDLVHEVPRDFNPKSAFLSSLAPMKRSFVLRVAALLLVSATGVAGVMLFRASQAQSVGPDAIPPVVQNSALESMVSPPALVENANNEAVVVPSETGVVNNHTSRKTVVLTRQVRPRAASAVNAIADSGPTRETPAAPLAVATPQTESHVKKANTTLSPQVIAPSKGPASKAKVIQWP